MEQNKVYWAEFREEHLDKKGVNSVLSWRGFYIKGKDKAIISDNDFVHYLVNAGDKPEISPCQEFYHKDGTRTFNMMRPTVVFKDVAEFEKDCKFTDANIPEQGHVFGSRKARVESNYSLFCESVKGIGCNVELPKWGREEL
jgi:hypothetical protein